MEGRALVLHLNCIAERNQMNKGVSVPPKSENPLPRKEWCKLSLYVGLAVSASVVALRSVRIPYFISEVFGRSTLSATVN